MGHNGYPKDCRECALLDADPHEEWSRIERCTPMCFWQAFEPASRRLLEFWSECGAGEAISETITQYSVDWAVFAELWPDYRDAADGGTYADDRRSLARAMLHIRDTMNCRGMSTHDDPIVTEGDDG